MSSSARKVTPTSKAMEGQQTGAVASDFDVFCHMVFEEFLMRKGLHGTLASFRQEWSRPTEEHTMLSWYETALKLRLPEIVHQGSEHATVMENLVLALLREASIKSRHAPDVLVAGLATLPRPRNLPSLPPDATTRSISGGGSSMADDDFGRRSPQPQSIGASAKGSQAGSSIVRSLDSRTSANQPASREKPVPASPATAAVTKKLSKKAFGNPSLGQSTVQLSDESAQIIKRQLEDMAAEKALSTRVKGYIKPSTENWIPEITRMKSLERDLAVAKDNLADIQVREAMENNEMKQFRVTALEKAIKAESLGKMHRQACGCCMLIFLPINLPLKVSQKAVLDIRIKWSGGLDSETVFGRESVRQIEEGVSGSSAGGGISDQAKTGAGASPDGVEASKPPKGSSSQQAFLDKMAERLSVVPRCYDEVPVCLFCSQFFQDAEQYRPSYDRIYQDERRAVHQAARAREKLYWDPLLMVERDREAEESMIMAGSVSDEQGSSSIVE